MSIVSRAAKKTTAAPATAGRGNREASEFDGFWLNLGLTMAGDEGEENTFVRIPRGVAVSDLKPQSIYASMDPNYAASVKLVNNIIAAVHAACANMAEGESKPIALDVVLYRRQEEADVETSKDEISDLTKTLFG